MHPLSNKLQHIYYYTLQNFQMSICVHASLDREESGGLLSKCYVHASH